MLINIVSENVFHCNRQEHALQLAANGFALLPLKPKEKTPYTELLPLVNGKPSWAVYRNKPPSADDVKAWFEYDPDVNIGIITGPSSMGGLYVLDLDKKPPAAFGPLPPTVIVKTGRSNGWHYYFTCSKELKTFSFGCGSLQGSGSYVVAAGSVHPSGAVYEYADGLSPDQVELMQLPDWLADGRKRKKYLKEQVEDSEASPAAAPTDCIKQGEQDRFSTPFLTPFQNRHRNNSVTMRTLSFPDLEGLNERPEIAFKLMAICGRQVNKIGKAFSCPLPGHGEKKPSAALYQVAGRPIILNDFHEREAGRFSWPLVDVYASCKIGKPVELRAGERAIWWLRALDEIGEVNPPSLVRRELPQEAKPAAVKVYDGFCYLLRLRQLYEPSRAAPFNRTFAAKWCNTDTDTIRRGMSWLLRRGYLTIAERGRPNHAEGGPALTFFAVGMPDERRDRK